MDEQEWEGFEGSIIGELVSSGVPSKHLTVPKKKSGRKAERKLRKKLPPKGNEGRTPQSENPFEVLKDEIDGEVDGKPEFPHASTY